MNRSCYGINKIRYTILLYFGRELNWKLWMNVDGCQSYFIDCLQESIIILAVCFYLFCKEKVSGHSTIILNPLIRHQLQLCDHFGLRQITFAACFIFRLDLKRFILHESHSHLSECWRDSRPSKEHLKKFQNLVMNYHNKKFNSAPGWSCGLRSELTDC